MVTLGYSRINNSGQSILHSLLHKNLHTMLNSIANSWFSRISNYTAIGFIVVRTQVMWSTILSHSKWGNSINAFGERDSLFYPIPQVILTMYLILSSVPPQSRIFLLIVYTSSNNHDMNYKRHKKWKEGKRGGRERENASYMWYFNTVFASRKTMLPIPQI